MEKIKLTKSQFVEYLRNLKGCQFVNVIALTEADMNKRNNAYYGRVMKLSITPMQIGFDYQKAVNNRLKREGKEPNFIAESLKWGEWEIYNKVIAHKGEQYLRTYCVKNRHPKTYYLLDGRLATKEEFTQFSQFFKTKTASQKQTDMGLEEEEQVKPRNYKFSNLVSITINHTRFYIED